AHASNPVPKNLNYAWNLALGWYSADFTNNNQVYFCYALHSAC
ncbi:cytochrome b, partial [Wolbachia endosymbiont of Drosophila ananassae]